MEGVRRRGYGGGGTVEGVRRRGYEGGGTVEGVRRRGRGESIKANDKGLKLEPSALATD